MKIKITNDEFYEIKMPEQIDIREFRSIVMKFNFLLKNFAKFDIDEDSEDIVLNNSQVKQIKTKNNNKWKFLRDNRKAFLEILNAHYHKSNEELEELFNKYNLDFQKKDMSSNQIIRIRELHKVNPQELGVIRFPSRNEPLSEVRLGNGVQVVTGEQNE